MSFSTGTVSSRKARHGRTVQSESTSALSRLAILSCTSSRFPTRQEHSGTIHIIVGYLIINVGDVLMFLLIATQYCDGLRGAMVVYDTLDPHRSRYVRAPP